MGLGFSVKVAPGIRIRASSRGVRTSFGPRAARLHVGSGRTGFSSGAGPVTFYTSLSRSRRSTAPGPRGAAGVTTTQRTLAQAAKAEEAKELQAALTKILTLHQQDFPSATRPIAPESEPLPTKSVRSKHRKEKLRGIGLFRRSARRAAKAEADAAANEELRQLDRQREQDRKQHQDELDHWWATLYANSEDVVLDVVGRAFDDNEAPAAPVGVEDSELTVVVLVPGLDTVPERKPTTTAAGNLSLKKLTKTERCGLHAILVASHVLLTVREALAVAPGITAVRAVALRHSRTDAFGEYATDVVMAARFDRDRLAAVRWESTQADDILHDAATDLVINMKRATSELLPIDLVKEPALANLMARVEIDELVER